jgi:hypothetical protein
MNRVELVTRVELVNRVELAGGRAASDFSRSPRRREHLPSVRYCTLRYWKYGNSSSGWVMPVTFLLATTM